MRKNAYENIRDVIDGYWGHWKAPARSDGHSGRAVDNLDAYLAARNVDTRVNLPAYFKVRYEIPVYRCYAPYLAVCCRRCPSPPRSWTR
ncbi:hypothetical protein, partial [Treponema endosymbiont of Eucomonympha sp.]|uniref:hypothetical protein n=1 Tax=Treponema endosymbiont of Eucomonympha sp. TaxID=1580831 RepID=UPI001396C091